MMADISLTGVLVVAAVGFTVPLVLGLAPTLRLPSVVLEIVVGIVIGPAILGPVEVDLPLQILALLGLAFLLLAGLLSVVLFPFGALTLLRDIGKPAAVPQRDGLDGTGGDDPGPT